MLKLIDVKFAYKVNGKGYAVPTVKQILEIAFSELKFNRVYLTAMADNVPAIRAYEKAGFEKEGLMKEDFLRYDGFVDIVMMGITAKKWCEIGNCKSRQSRDE